jgi:hypothetical protein
MRREVPATLVIRHQTRRDLDADADTLPRWDIGMGRARFWQPADQGIEDYRQSPWWGSGCHLFRGAAEKRVELVVAIE